MNNAEIEESRQYLTFSLGEEKYAVEVFNIREILDCTTITRVPRASESMRGVINLRGSVVPVVDMRMKLGMTPTEETINTCIIVVEMAVDGETILIGALADSVQEVMEIDAGQIEAAPRIGLGSRSDFIRGMGKCGERFIMILDIDKVFCFGDSPWNNATPASWFLLKYP